MILAALLCIGGATAHVSLPVPRFETQEVRAGHRVDLRWTSLGDAAEELEVILSMDDGRNFDVRVSPELARGTSRYVWSVPNVGVGSARIRLRARIGGREVSGPASHAFRIVAKPSGLPERWSFHAGEWWEDAAGESFTMPGLVTPERGPSLHEKHPRDHSARPARSRVFSVPAQPPLAFHSRLHATSFASVPPRVSPPRYSPLRE